MYPQKPRPDRRATRRWNVMWPATLVIEGREHPCTILDLSALGACLEVQGLAAGPSTATLRSEQFDSLECRILWTRGVEAGIRFEAAPEAVMQLLKPVVPGLGRREKVIEATPPLPARRRSFSRFLREKLAG